MRGEGGWYLVLFGNQASFRVLSPNPGQLPPKRSFSVGAFLFTVNEKTEKTQLPAVGGPRDHFQNQRASVSSHSDPLLPPDRAGSSS